MNIEQIKLSSVIFDESLYPRKQHDPVTVQKYTDCLEEIESAEKYITVSKDYRLLDGKHRWLAYRTVYENEPDRLIPAFVDETPGDAQQFKVAIRLNSQHGYQLSQSDKKDCAIKMFHMRISPEEIRTALSVSKRTVSNWLESPMKDQRERTNQTIMDMYLACYSQEEIAAAVDMPQKTVGDRIANFSDFGNLAKSAKTHANHEEQDFQVPLYNVWTKSKISTELKHFGNSEITWLDNLLYLYTKPFDIVIDPFAGSGSAIDLCKKRMRRFLVSDRKPIVSREKEIRKHDVIVDGIPKPPQWKDVSLVYLDPPYWKQAEGEYSDDKEDLANVSLEEFHDKLFSVIDGFSKKLHAGAKIALIIQPTQWKADNRGFEDHIANMIQRVKLPIVQRIQAPYSTQQANAQMVEWAKENKQLLVISREIIVWQK